MIKGSQLVPCADCARDIRDALAKLEAVERKLRLAGVWSRSAELLRANDTLRGLARDLDSDALAAFCAARRGEELPK